MKLTKIESYEIQAFAFHVMTGYMAPGKDVSPLACEAPYEERCAAWDEWRNKHAHCILAMLHGFEALIDRDDEPTGALLDEMEQMRELADALAHGTHFVDSPELHEAMMRAADYLRACADAQPAPAVPQAEPKREPLPGLAPTHRCPACGALWRQCDDSSWNLRSALCCGLCDAGRVELVRLLDEPKREPSCLWSRADDDTDVWETKCGHAFMIIDGTPTDNQMAFCCYCGRRVDEEIGGSDAE